VAAERSSDSTGAAVAALGRRHVMALKWIVAFLSGTLVGLAVGVLYAPYSGERTRRKILRQTGRIADKASDVVETAGEQFTRVRRSLA
jgi:gas vesicle protein